VIWSGTPARPKAASNPPKPAPTSTTRCGSFGAVVMAVRLRFQMSPYRLCRHSRVRSMTPTTRSHYASAAIPEYLSGHDPVACGRGRGGDVDGDFQPLPEGVIGKTVGPT